MSTYLSAALRKQLVEADNGQYAYCQTREDNTGQALTIDHIVPVAKNGPTTFDNLCRACRRCNESKREQISGIDPLTGESELIVYARRRWVGAGWHPPLKNYP